MDSKTFFERTGAILIVICVIALLGAFGYSYYLAKTKAVQPISVSVIVKVDSTGVVTPESSQFIDDLKAEMVRHEQLLEDRYKHVLEQKEDMNDLLSIGGMFLAVVLALFGFFGYKSMSSIEEKVQKETERIADSKVDESVKKKMETYSKQTVVTLTAQIDAQVGESVEKSMAEYKVAAKRQLEAAIDQKLTDSLQKVCDLEGNIADLTESMENVDQKLAKVSDRVIQLEAQNSLAKRGRRTLSNGGQKV